MPNTFEVEIKVDNRDKILQATDDGIERALEAIGQQAENYAILLCPVDTGLLRNSITHAVSGKSPAKKSYKSNATHKSTEATKRAGTAGKAVTPTRTGQYQGTEGEDGEMAVYIGTNVEYAPYVELGTSNSKPQPFIKPAVENHKAEYVSVFNEMIGSGLENNDN